MVRRIRIKCNGSLEALTRIALDLAGFDRRDPDVRRVECGKVLCAAAANVDHRAAAAVRAPPRRNLCRDLSDARHFKRLDCGR